jgi:hypothetical protein
LYCSFNLVSSSHTSFLLTLQLSIASIVSVLKLPSDCLPNLIKMGGGGTALNIFKLNRGGDPPEVLNWRLWLAVFSFGIMGAARGVDEGLISGTLDSANFKKLLNFPNADTQEFANIKGNISSMVQIGSVAGAAL